MTRDTTDFYIDGLEVRSAPHGRTRLAELLGDDDGDRLIKRVLERKGFLDERARMAALFRNAEVSAAEGTKKYPELEGSYVQLQLGRAMSEQQYATEAHRDNSASTCGAILRRKSSRADRWSGRHCASGAIS